MVRLPSESHGFLSMPRHENNAVRSTGSALRGRWGLFGERRLYLRRSAGLISDSPVVLAFAYCTARRAVAGVGSRSFQVVSCLSRMLHVFPNVDAERYRRSIISSFIYDVVLSLRLRKFSNEHAAVFQVMFLALLNGSLFANVWTCW